MITVENERLKKQRRKVQIVLRTTKIREGEKSIVKRERKERITGRNKRHKS